MSADWFCKIGEKTYGPFNGQQLKTVAAKGKLKPEHLVRRGSEGTWVPAGRIKGLFTEGAGGNAQAEGKKLPQASAKPAPKAAKSGTPSTAKAASLPAAAEASTPPASDIPQELTLGEHHKHRMELNVDSLDIETVTVDVSRRKVKSGLQGLRKEERKKLTLVLLGLIAGCTTIGTLAIVFAVKSGKLRQPDVGDIAKGSAGSAVAAPAVDTGKKPESEPPPAKPVQETVPSKWTTLGVGVEVGNVEVKVLNHLARGPLPKDVKADKPDEIDVNDVLFVPVMLELKKGDPVKLTSWADKNLKKKDRASLKDDTNLTYVLIGQVPGEGITVTKDRIKVQLIFEAPTSEKLKFLHLTLPGAALHVDQRMVGYDINAKDIPPEKPAEADKPDNPTKPGEGDSGEKTSTGDKKKPPEAKPADAGKGDKKEPGKAKPADSGTGST